MGEFYLFEAGATKTAFVKVMEGGTEETILPPYNPNRKYDAFEIAIKEGIDIIPDSKILFYGAGLSSEANKQITRELFSQHAPSSLKVYDDILGAARATCGDRPGIVCVMGTGGLAAHYDGRRIQNRRGGYGYLIDDLGGGFELGKRFVALWLNGDLSERGDNILKAKLNMNKNTFLKEFYRHKEVDQIANLTPYVLQFEDEPAVSELIESYFDDFIKRQVLPICEANGMESFSVVGSVGYFFYRALTKSAKKHKLSVDQCVQNPITRLVKYHS